MSFWGTRTLSLCLGAIGQVRSDSIYWADYDGGDIRRANLDGSAQQTLITGLPSPVAIALDVAGGYMYWTEFGTGGGGEIRRANLDGSGQTTLVSKLTFPEGIALDLAGGKLYWAGGEGAGVIERANLDGSGQEILLRDLPNPISIRLDLAGGKMYWANQSGDNSIQRANLDGSGVEALLGYRPKIHGLALDLAGGKMYWAETNSPGRIGRANLDGSGIETLVGGLLMPNAIALDVLGGKMYWSDHGSGDIRRANLDGSGQEILVQNLNGPAAAGIALDLSAPASQPIAVTGHSADVISDKDSSVRLAQPFNAGTFAWFEAVAVDDSGAQHNDGLPAGQSFVSATGSRATYQLQPANAQNVLQLGAGQTGTLTLTTPAAYSTLYVIASSGDGTPTSVGSGNIKFADGSQQAFSYNAFDWCNGQGGLHPEAVLSGPIGRADVGPNGAAFAYNQDCDFEIYETVIPIDPSHAGVAIVSIDFTGAPDAFFSNIFGASGR
jgi:sugar lactone lactonase YvrE